jgi:hydroxyacylglutathione hydrolase
MNIKQFSYDKGNLAYLLWSGSEAVAIDGGAVEEIMDFLSENNLTLKIVTNTHGHDDHTCGNEQLLKKTKAQFIPASDLNDKSQIPIGGEILSVISTPGHTMDSIVFYFDNILITGDTLFNGTVGNCYSGNYELYFKSLKKLIELPKERIIYAGHDLIEYSTGVIVTIEPDNAYVEAYKRDCRTQGVFSTLGGELRVNPFIRFNDSALDPFRSSLKRPVGSAYERWLAMMTVH